MTSQLFLLIDVIWFTLPTHHVQNLLDSNKNVDLGRMYSLVSRISEGLKELKTVLEEHIHKQGVEVIAQCGDSAINVSPIVFLSF